MRELRGEVREMERKLEKAREQERLLVEYPDLNGPVNKDLTGVYSSMVLVTWISQVCIAQWSWQHRPHRCVQLNGPGNIDLTGVYSSMVLVTQISQVCIAQWSW